MNRIHHLRSKNFNGGMTVLTEYDSTEDTTTVRFSICSIHDQYNKSRGISLAHYAEPLTVPGPINTDSQLVAKLFPLLTTETRRLAIKSILYSMAMRKLTTTAATAFRDLYANRARSHAIARFLERSHQLGNNVTLKEITLLHDIIPFI